MKYLTICLALVFVSLPSTVHAQDSLHKVLMEEITALREAVTGFETEAVELRAEADALRVVIAEKDEVILNLNLNIDSLNTIIATHQSDLNAKEQERIVAYTNWQRTEKELADYRAGKVQPAERAIWVGAFSAVSAAFVATLVKDATTP